MRRVICSTLVATHRTWWTTAREGGGVSLPDPGASISISVGHTQGVNPVTVEYQWLDGERRLWSARAFQAVCRSMKYDSIKLNGRMDKMRLLMLGRFMVAGKQSICVRSLSASLRRFVASSCRPTRTSHNAVRVVRSAVWVQITTRQLWSRRNSYWVIFLTVEYFCRCIVPPQFDLQIAFSDKRGSIITCSWADLISRSYTRCIPTL